MCQVTHCYKKFGSAKSLVNHMNLQHYDNNRLNLNCKIDGCSYLYNSVETFRKHLRNCHIEHWEDAVDFAAERTCETAADVEYVPMLAFDDSHAMPQKYDDQQKWNKFLNDFAKRTAFLSSK
jgi:hypothetical protein